FNRVSQPRNNAGAQSLVNSLSIPGKRYPISACRHKVIRAPSVRLRLRIRILSQESGGQEPKYERCSGVASRASQGVPSSASTSVGLGASFDVWKVADNHWVRWWCRRRHRWWRQDCHVENQDSCPSPDTPKICFLNTQSSLSCPQALTWILRNATGDPGCDWSPIKPIGLPFSLPTPRAASGLTKRVTRTCEPISVSFRSTV